MKRARRGFTLVELLVTIGIVSCLAVLLSPTLRRTIASADQAKCASNLRQLGMGVKHYAAENNDEIPYLVSADNTRSWVGQIAPYLDVPLGPVGSRPPDPYRCPSCKYTTVGGSGSNYGKNYYLNSYPSDTSPSRTGIRFSAIANPSQYYLIADSTKGPDGQASRTIGKASNPPSTEFTKYWIEVRHQKKANVLFCDLHVESLGIDQIADPVANTAPWIAR